MATVTLSEFRSRQSELIASVQREPLELLSRGAKRRAVVVSPEFYDRAVEALEDKLDIAEAAEARREPSLSYEKLMSELG